MEKKSISKKSDSDRKFALLGKATIKLFAESVGHSVTDDVAKAFGEDVNYRIREIVSDATQYMKHSKRSQLTVNDVSEALKDSNSSVVTNYLSKTHRWLPEVRLHVLNEEPISMDELIEKDNPPNENPSSITVTESWLNASSKGESLLNNRVSMQSLSQYFTQITEALSSDEEAIRKEALADIIDNHTLPHIQTQLLLFTKKWMERAVEHADNMRKALEVLDALTNNRYVFIYKDKQWDIVSKILLDITCLKCHQNQKDHQQYGAKILSKIVRSPYFPESRRTDLLDTCITTLRSDNCGDSVTSLGAMYILCTIQPLVVLRDDLIPDWLNLIATESNNIYQTNLLSILLDCICHIVQISRNSPLTRHHSVHIHQLVSTFQSNRGYLLPCRFLTAIPLAPDQPLLIRAPAWRSCRQLYPRRYPPRPCPSFEGRRTTGPAWEGCAPPVPKQRQISVTRSINLPT